MEGKLPTIVGPEYSDTSSRSSSPNSTSNAHVALFPSDIGLNDHRHQPDSLPVRESFELRRIATNATHDSGSFSESGERREVRGMRDRGLSNASCAISTRSVGSVNSVVPEGILLNKGNNERRSSRRYTKSSVHSKQDDDDNDSQISFGDDNQEDVCFPMYKSDELTGIDFETLDDLAANTSVRKDTSTEEIKFNTNSFSQQQQQSLPNRSQHRPLVPFPEGSGGSRLGSNNSSPNSDPASDSTKVEVSISLKEDEKVPVSNPIQPEFQLQDFPGAYKVSEGPGPAGANKPSVNERFSFFASEVEQTIHSVDFAGLIESGQSFRDLFNDSNGTWWLDCLNPSDNEMRILSKAFGIHPLTVEDIKTEESREKVELFKTYYFVCFHTFDTDRNSEDFLEPVNTYMIVFKGGILSFHFSTISHCANVRRRIRQLRDYVTVSSDWICYALIDDITDSFAPIIREIEVEADVIEDSVFTYRESDFMPMLRRIGEARRKTMTVLRLLSGKADVIKMFAKRCNEHWDNAPKGEIGLYLGDIQDHIVTMHQNLTVYEKIFSRSHANYLAWIQVASFSSNNRITQVLGRATIIGTVLVPMNLITGLFGMNVRVPGEQGSNLGWFFGILGIIIAVVTVLCYIATTWLNRVEEHQPLPDEDEDDNSRSRNGLFSSAASIISAPRRPRAGSTRVSLV